MSSTESSPASSRRSSFSDSTTQEEKMQIFVRNHKGQTTELSLPSSTTIAHLHSLLCATQPSPTPSRLTFYNRSLSPTSTLASNHIPSSSLLELAPGTGKLLGGGPKRIRCQHKDCKEQAQRIVGDCGFCGNHFCGKHRLLESHNCTGLEDCKEADRQRNKEKLEGERTQVVRGV